MSHVFLLLHVVLSSTLTINRTQKKHSSIQLPDSFLPFFWSPPYNFSFYYCIARKKTITMIVGYIFVLDHNGRASSLINSESFRTCLEYKCSPFVKDPRKSDPCRVVVFFQNSLLLFLCYLLRVQNVLNTSSPTPAPPTPLLNLFALSFLSLLLEHSF